MVEEMVTVTCCELQQSGDVFSAHPIGVWNGQGGILIVLRSQSPLPDGVIVELVWQGETVWHSPVRRPPSEGLLLPDSYLNYACSISAKALQAKRLLSGQGTYHLSVKAGDRVLGAGLLRLQTEQTEQTEVVQTFAEKAAAASGRSDLRVVMGELTARLAAFPSFQLDLSTYEDDETFYEERTLLVEELNSFYHVVLQDRLNRPLNLLFDERSVSRWTGERDELIADLQQRLSRMYGVSSEQADTVWERSMYLTEQEETGLKGMWKPRKQSLKRLSKRFPILVDLTLERCSILLHLIEEGKFAWLHVSGLGLDSALNGDFQPQDLLVESLPDRLNENIERWAAQLAETLSPLREHSVLFTGLTCLPTVAFAVEAVFSDNAKHRVKSLAWAMCE